MNRSTTMAPRGTPPFGSWVCRTALLLGIVASLPSCLAWHGWHGAPERLPARPSSIAASWPDGVRDIRGVVHAHCYLSSDSEGTLERIAAAAREAGVAFVALTDHPSDRFIDAAPRGAIDGVWFIPGGELRARSQRGSILAIGLRETPAWHAADDRALVAEIERAGGLAVIGHAEKFSAPDIPGIQGFEIANLHSMVQATSTLGLVLRGLFLTPGAFARSVIDRPTANLATFGRLLDQGRVLSVTAGCDAHENVRFMGLLFGTYQEMFRTMTTHLLLEGDVTQEKILGALRHGHGYAAIEAFGASDGFSFVARSAPGPDESPVHALPGDRLRLSPGVELRACAPGRPTFILRRGSRIVATGGADGLVYRPTVPGSYWLEVLQGETHPWIYTSAIRLQGGPRKSGHPPAPDDRANLFQFSPVALERIAQIVPLGNLNPPGHVFPTDHIYVVLEAKAPDGKVPETRVVAPGRLTILDLMRFEHLRAGVVDYSLRGRAGPHSVVTFGHLNRPAERITGGADDWRRTGEYTTGGETYRTWRLSSSIEVEAGELLGWIGGPGGSRTLDFGLYDDRSVPPQIASPRRWTRTPYLHAVPPLSRYPAGPLREGLCSLLQRVGDEAESSLDAAAPLGGAPWGRILQDLPGTAQGCWFARGHESTNPEDPHLALVRSNTRPGRAVFSVGTSLATLPSGVYSFQPRDDGVLNREFSEVRPDGKTYTFSVEGLSGVILLSLPDPQTLWIEHLPAGSEEPPIFSDSHSVYLR